MSDWQQRSPPNWSGVDLAVSLARVEEGVRHLYDQSRGFPDQLHTIRTRIAATDGRVTNLENEAKKTSELVSELKPIAETFRRREDRKRFLKDLLNWLSIPTVLYLALTGKVPWDAALRALGKIFGVG